MNALGDVCTLVCQTYIELILSEGCGNTFYLPCVSCSGDNSRNYTGLYAVKQMKNNKLMMGSGTHTKYLLQGVISSTGRLA